MKPNLNCCARVLGLVVLLGTWAAAAGLEAPASVPGVPVPADQAAPSAAKPGAQALFRAARWECFDGHAVATSLPQCLTLQEWQLNAAKNCRERCRQTPSGRKCGVNTFETLTLCSGAKAP